MADATEIDTVTPNIQSWLSQGEQLYSTAFAEFRGLEAEMEALEKKLAAKQAEVNQIAQIIGKPMIEASHPVSVVTPVEVQSQLDQRLPIPAIPMTPPSQMNPPSQNSSANATIARALTGKFGR